MKMPLWLVQHTTEFAPGPWVFVPFTAGLGNRGAVRECAAGVEGRTLAIVPPSPMLDPEADPDTGERSDVEADATGRLLADAPALLILCATMLQGIQAAFAASKTKPAAVQATIDAAIALIAKHVRTGCAPADEAARAPLRVYDVPGNPLEGQ